MNTIGAAASLKADFGSGLWNGGPIGIPFITVSGTQTKYPATFLYADESDPGPYAVPLNAPIEGGSASDGDRHAITIDTDHCVLYELYRAFPQSASWQADSGAIFNLLSNALRPATWTSADAAGLPIFLGLVRYEEVLAGEINHAIRFTVPHTRRAYVWPARHYASSLTDTIYPPMGQRFRLRASFDISSFSPQNQVILRALKKYGMILADNGSAWYMSGAPDERWDNSMLADLKRVVGLDFEAVDVSSLMVDPNSGQARQTAVFVSVTPSTANVLQGQKQQFTASVTNSTDQSVSWSVNGALGGNATVGWVDATGMYTAPASVPNPATVSVSATSVSTPAANGSATVTISAPLPPPTPIQVTITPTSATLRTKQSLKFVATVTGATNPAVIWKVNGVTGGNSTVGRISSSGTYTAPSTVPSPSTVTIKAVSASDATAFATAPVQITRR